jgi:hypothetical protein
LIATTEVPTVSAPKISSNYVWNVKRVQ